MFWDGNSSPRASSTPRATLLAGAAGCHLGEDSAGSFPTALAGIDVTPFVATFLGAAAQLHPVLMHRQNTCAAVSSTGSSISKHQCDSNASSPDMPRSISSGTPCTTPRQHALSTSSLAPATPRYTAAGNVATGTSTTRAGLSGSPLRPVGQTQHGCSPSSASANDASHTLRAAAGAAVGLVAQICHDKPALRGCLPDPVLQPFSGLTHETQGSYASTTSMEMPQFHSVCAMCRGSMLPADSGKAVAADLCSCGKRSKQPAPLTVSASSSAGNSSWPAYQLTGNVGHTDTLTGGGGGGVQALSSMLLQAKRGLTSRFAARQACFKSKMREAGLELEGQHPAPSMASTYSSSNVTSASFGQGWSGIAASLPLMPIVCEGAPLVAPSHASSFLSPGSQDAWQGDGGVAVAVAQQQHMKQHGAPKSSYHEQAPLVLSGAACRTLAQLVIHPLDTIKTRLQVTLPVPALQQWQAAVASAALRPMQDAIASAAVRPMLALPGASAAALAEAAAAQYAALAALSQSVLHAGGKSTLAVGSIANAALQAQLHAQMQVAVPSLSSNIVPLSAGTTAATGVGGAATTAVQGGAGAITSMAAATATAATANATMTIMSAPATAATATAVNSNAARASTKAVFSMSSMVMTSLAYASSPGSNGANVPSPPALPKGSGPMATLPLRPASFLPAGSLGGNLALQLPCAISAAGQQLRSAGTLVSERLRAYACRGPADLYLGLLSAVAGASASALLYFGTDAAVKGMLQEKLGWERTSMASHLLSATTAASVAAIAKVPADVIKHKVQAYIYPSSKSALHALLAGCPTGRPGGALYAGFGATLLRDVPEMALQFTLYEALKHAVAVQAHGASHGAGGAAVSVEGVATQQLPPQQAALLGAVAGAGAALCTTPLDVLKAQLQTAGAKSVGAAMSSVLRVHGAAGLFRGAGLRVTQTSLMSAVFFASYERCKVLIKERQQLEQQELAAA